MAASRGDGGGGRVRGLGGGRKRGSAVFGGKRSDARASGTGFDDGGRFRGEGRARYRDL